MVVCMPCGLYGITLKIEVSLPLAARSFDHGTRITSRSLTRIAVIEEVDPAVGNEKL